MTSLPANDDRAARDAFATWVSWQAGAPRDAAALIRKIEVSHEYLGLLDTRYEGRRAVWHFAPANALARVSRPAIDAVDPWSIDPATLRRDTEHVTECHTCNAEKTMRCEYCGGDGRAICGACNGQRKAYGYAVNGAYRLMNCKVCRGKGEVICGGCHAGRATCLTCGGEGRLQRWIEVESWQRAVANVHPRNVGVRFGWDDDPENAIVARDAQLLLDLVRPRALTASDLGDVPREWLTTLGSPVATGERIVQQRLRIARVPTHHVHYRLGNTEDQIAFAGLRLLGPTSQEGSAFGARVSRLASLRWLLFVVAIAIALVSLGRGAFFWSFWTLASLAACIASLIAIEFAAADWTAARRSTTRYLAFAAAFLILAIACAAAALPRLGHAQGFIAAGNLDAAERELDALGAKATPAAWADLRLAQIRRATDVSEAQTTLAEIPRDLPQSAEATDVVDALILRNARKDAGFQRWANATAALAHLSERVRQKPDAIQAAAAILLPAAQFRIDRTDWSGAANVLRTASRIGIRDSTLVPLNDAIRAAAAKTAAEAKRERDARRRLRLRLAAEETYVAWENATGQWGTADLIELRTAMARDVALVERSERHAQ